MVRILQMLKKGREKEALERLKEQMQEHPGMGLQAIWHWYHSEQVTKDTDPGRSRFSQGKATAGETGILAEAVREEVKN